MDIKDIVSKEVLGEDVSSLTKDFTEEQVSEYHKTRATAFKEASDKAQADFLARKEAHKKNLEALDHKTNTDAVDEVKKQIRSEQIAKAKARVVAELGLTADEVVNLDTHFNTVDSGAIDADLIVGDLYQAYAKMHAPQAVTLMKEQRAREVAAAKRVADAAAGNGAGGQGTENKQFNPETLRRTEALKSLDNKITPERVEKIETQRTRTGGFVRILDQGPE